jgi:hypothetical protein
MCSDNFDHTGSQERHFVASQPHMAGRPAALENENDREWDWSENEGAGASEPSDVVVVKTPKVNLVRLAWSAPWNELRLAEQLVKA